MRNGLLAVFLMLIALAVAGCEETGQKTSSSGSSSTATAKAAPATAAAPVEQAPPPPARNSTTQPLPPGWAYIKSGDLAAGPLK